MAFRLTRAPDDATDGAAFHWKELSSGCGAGGNQPSTGRAASSAGAYIADKRLNAEDIGAKNIMYNMTLSKMMWLAASPMPYQSSFTDSTSLIFFILTLRGR
jgi:hypothetical protein